MTLPSYRVVCVDILFKSRRSVKQLVSKSIGIKWVNSWNTSNDDIMWPMDVCLVVEDWNRWKWWRRKRSEDMFETDASRLGSFHSLDNKDFHKWKIKWSMKCNEIRNEIKFLKAVWSGMTHIHKTLPWA